MFCFYSGTIFVALNYFKHIKNALTNLQLIQNKEKLNYNETYVF